MGPDPDSAVRQRRIGAILTETTQAPANVNAGWFGMIFSLRVDGDVYAQPLFVRRVGIPGKGIHNIIFVVTEHDSVYALTPKPHRTRSGT